MAADPEKDPRIEVIDRQESRRHVEPPWIWDCLIATWKYTEQWKVVSKLSMPSATPKPLGMYRLTPWITELR